MLKELLFAKTLLGAGSGGDDPGPSTEIPEIVMEDVEVPAGGSGTGDISFSSFDGYYPIRSYYATVGDAASVHVSSDLNAFDIIGNHAGFCAVLCVVEAEKAADGSTHSFGAVCRCTVTEE